MLVSNININELGSFDNANQVLFKGLTGRVSRRIYVNSHSTVKQMMIDRGEQKSSIVGSLPRFIINKLPVENREAAIKDIYETFTQISKELTKYREENRLICANGRKNRYESTANLFKNLVAKYNLAPNKYTDVDIVYLGKGGRGAAYKLVGLKDSNMQQIFKAQAAIANGEKINLKKNHLRFKDGYDDEFVIKVFFDDHFGCENHGCCAEVNGAQYWRKHVGNNTQRGKFFFADLKNNYMISKYIDEDVSLPQKYVPLIDHGIVSTDENFEAMQNVCKQYGFDWGGLDLDNIVLNHDKVARHYNGLIKKTEPKYRNLEWNKLFFKTRVSNEKNKNAGLALSIRYMDNKNEYFEKCIALNQVEVNRALGYSLKYLPHDDAIQYYKKLIQTKDPLTQIILIREIPKLSMNIIDNPTHGNFKFNVHNYNSNRYNEYKKIAKEFAMPEVMYELRNLVV